MQSAKYFCRPADVPVVPGPQREREEGAGPQTHPPPLLIGVIDDSDAVTGAENKHSFFSNFSFFFSIKHGGDQAG